MQVSTICVGASLVAAGGFQGELVVRNYRQEALAFRWSGQFILCNRQHPSRSLNDNHDLCCAAALGCKLWHADRHVCGRFEQHGLKRLQTVQAARQTLQPWLLIQHKGLLSTTVQCQLRSYPSLQIGRLPGWRGCSHLRPESSCRVYSSVVWSCRTLALNFRCCALPCSSRITLDENGITNAIEISQQGADTPRLITSNNDKLVRVFDSQSFQITR